MAWPNDLNPQQSLTPEMINLMSMFGQKPMQDTVSSELKKPAGFMDNFGMAEAFSAGTDILGGLLSYQGLQEGKRQNRQANALSLTNLGNQAKLTNATLEGRQRTHLAADPNATSVADYMSKFGVSGTV